MFGCFDQSAHPAVYRAAKAIDQFRDAPDAKRAPTLFGLFLTLVVVPCLLVVYFWYIYSNNETVYATTVIHAGYSRWLGQSMCWAEGGCFYAGAFQNTSCVPYAAEGLMQYVPYGQMFLFNQSDIMPQYSDGSNADYAATLLMIASVNQSAYHVGSQALSTQLLWSISMQSIKVAQGNTLDSGLSVSYDSTQDSPFEANVRGANADYAIKVVLTMSSLTDNIADTVRGTGGLPVGIGTTLIHAVQATFSENSDTISACAQSTLFRSLSCSGSNTCVTATVTLNPVVTSTTIYKQNTLTALFAQVGGNASNVVVLLSMLMTAYHAWWNRGAQQQVRPLGLQEPVVVQSPK